MLPRQGQRMAVQIRKRKFPSGVMHWQADIRVRLPDGRYHRERCKAPGKSRSAALKWARQREAHLLRFGRQGEEGTSREQDVPTFAEFVSRFLTEHVEANRLAPATRRHYDVVLRTHLLPVLGEVPLDEVGASHVQALKRRGLKASTTNQVLAKLRAILRVAARWELIEHAPEITELREDKRQPGFYDFEAYARLVQAAREFGPEALALVRLGGDAGLRRGEIRGLRWANVHLDRGQLYVCENRTTGGGVRLPKGSKARWVPITKPLKAALKAVERPGDWVLCGSDGRWSSERALGSQLNRAQLRAGLPCKGLHILRHTFCSHLAMRGAHPVVIQRLAGHANTQTTEVYMHLAPSTLNEAIDKLREDEEDE
ncbi:MAG: site-specific integrase [Myxococcales bacterium]|nr:site-specific integrase [Myxococcales bacterium]